MDAGVWAHALLIVILVDLAALVAGLAMFVDHSLLNTGRRWRFGLGSLFLAMTLAVINLGVVTRLLFAG